MNPKEWMESLNDKLSSKQLYNLLYGRKELAVHCGSYKKVVRFYKFIKGSNYSIKEEGYIITAIDTYGKNLCIRMDSKGHTSPTSLEYCNEENILIIEYEELDIEEVLWKSIGG